MTTTSTRPPMPAWLKGHLINVGLWNADGITRKAKIRTHACGVIVLTGLDADTCAYPAVCDPTWLTPLGEALALIEGRHTYDYWLIARTIDGPRTHHRISYAPATDTGSTRVLATHVCGTRRLPHFDIPTTRTQEATDDPPF